MKAYYNIAPCMCNDLSPTCLMFLQPFLTCLTLLTLLCHSKLKVDLGGFIGSSLRTFPLKVLKMLNAIF